MSNSLKYSASDIAEFAAGQRCSVDEFRRRWIIMINGAYYIHGPHGYLSPIKAADLPVSMPRDLAPVPSSTQSPAGIDWETMTGQGTKAKTTEQIVKDHATVARRIITDMTIPRSFYDPLTQTFHERACELRKLEPAYDEQVDKWLRLLGGAQSDKLLDWIATSEDLSRVTCALYLDAPKGCGKTLFANGIARMWSFMATPIESMIADFNSAILNCPVVFADEEIPKKMSSGFIRKFIGSTTHPLKRKGLPESQLLGAVRLIIAANNPDVLKFEDEDFSGDDIDAIADKILYIKCNPESAAYIRSIGGREGTEGWLAGDDKIARHALWLCGNRKVELGSRYLVEGEATAVHRKIATQGNLRSLVVEWICKALVRTWMVENPGVRAGGGEIYVNASFVKDNWTEITGDQRIPSLHKIGKALKPLSTGEKRLYLGTEKRRADFYRISTKHIYELAAELQIATLKTFQAIVDRKTAILSEVDDDENVSAEYVPADHPLPNIVPGGAIGGGRSFLDPPK